MSDDPDDLNYDCVYNMFLGKSMITNLPRIEDRYKATRWMKKLANCGKALDEMKLRNDFLYYLVINIQNGELQPPFTENPPTSPLPSLAHLLPGGVGMDPDKATAWAEGNEAKQKQPLLYERSPDGGAFLAAQPVPRCGAFCYLAVVARNPRKE